LHTKGLKHLFKINIFLYFKNMKKQYIIILTIIGAFCNPVAKAQSDYKDVAPIFYAHCTSCHHENQHAPSMMNYTETSALAYSIVANLTSGIMPPWSPDTLYPRFVHERIISASEKTAIIDWINNGTLKGDTTLAPVAPVYPQYQLYGTPDLTLKIPTFTCNAGAADAYNCFSIPTGLTQNRILRAFEIIPGNTSIVHHVVVNLDTMGTTTSDLSGGCYTISGNFGIGDYVPGCAPTVFPGQAPLKAGITIKAGSKIVMQIHYPAGSAGLLDSTQIRMYFYPLNETGVRQIYSTVPLQNWSLSIPAGTTRTFVAKYPTSGTLPVNISVYSISPHSHKICTKITNYAYAATDTIRLYHTNYWDFEWQGSYTYPKMKKIPVGYKLVGSHFYDNTVNNPNSVSTGVVAGTSTSNEMLFDGINWMYYLPGDELIDVGAILANDPLLTPTAAGVNEVSAATGMQMYAYPNPASDKINIYFTKKSDYKIRLLNLTGQAILSTISVNDQLTLDIKNIPAGLYIVEATDTKNNQKNTKKIIISK
jgi:hypothetical protein